MFTIRSKKQRKLERYSQGLSMLCYSGIAAYAVPITPKTIPRSYHRKMLETLNIKNAASFWEVLDSLLNKGSREIFKKQAQYLLAFSESDRDLYVQSLPKEHAHRSDLIIVSYYLRRLPSEGIAAIDYAWCAYLCQAGLKFGYMNRSEYKTHLLNTALAAQSAYSSWLEFATAFAAGVQYVDGDTDCEYLIRNREVLTKLLASPYSPFHQVDWKMALV